MSKIEFDLIPESFITTIKEKIFNENSSLKVLDNKTLVHYQNLQFTHKKYIYLQENKIKIKSAKNTLIVRNISDFVDEEILFELFSQSKKKLFEKHL